MRSASCRSDRGVSSLTQDVLLVHSLYLTRRKTRIVSCVPLSTFGVLAFLTVLTGHSSVRLTSYKCSSKRSPRTRQYRKMVSQV